MNVMILGSGGREYSIGRAMKDDENVDKLYFAPGNGATENLGENVSIKDYYELAQFAKENNIEFTIVGPEAPLVDGVVDIFKSEGLTIFGPSKEAAQLEGSKVYMKNLNIRESILVLLIIKFIWHFGIKNILLESKNLLLLIV